MTEIREQDFNLLYDAERFIDFAKGYYARVFKAYDLVQGRHVAFKILRPEHLKQNKMNWEYQAFSLEANLLQHWHNQSCVVQLYDCGFVHDRSEMPHSGKIVSFQTDVQAFADLMPEFHQRGWRPFICEELLPETYNLFLLLREFNQGHRRRLPTYEGLDLCLQFANLMYSAHSDSIVYLDAKLEHFYWNGTDLCVIDWNSSKILPRNSKSGEAEAQKKQDIRNFVIGVMYPVFTGVPAEGHAFVERPSNRQDIAGRYQAVRELDFGMEPSLDTSLIDIMQKGSNWQYQNIEQYLSDLRNCAKAYGWINPGESSSPHITKSREFVQRGLAELREAQSKAEQARKSFLLAAERDGDNQEVRRLIELTRTFLDHRVIP